jgi:glycine dehydrogenase
MNQDIFHNYTSETNISRYITKLAAKDYTLSQGMIPLGSCTMKLNSVSQLEPLSWNEVCHSHPYSPPQFVKGYHTLIQVVGK